jgi:flagellin
MRSNLLSLQQTAGMINLTQNRLASGKKVNTPLDNPTNFFAAQAHLSRADDLLARKDGMGETVQIVRAADAGIKAITSLIDSAKGVVNAAMATSDTSDWKEYAGTFDTLLTQITQLASDSGYRGTNLLTSDSLTVEFGARSGTATMGIVGSNITSQGLGILKTYPEQTTSVGNLDNVSLVIRFNPQSDSRGDVNGNGVIEEGEGTEIDFRLQNTGSQAATNVGFSNAQISNGWNFLYNTSATMGDVPAGATVVTDMGSDLDLNIPSGSNGTSLSITMDFTADGETKHLTFGPMIIGSITNGQTLTAQLPPVTTSTDTNPWTSKANIQSSGSQLENALSTLRSKSSELSATLSVVTTRQDFTDAMINTMKTGADNLTLADMNEEGANMLMLQTRQNLGINSLSMAAQAAQSVMRLF